MNSKLSNKTNVSKRVAKGLGCLHLLLRVILVTDPKILIKCYKTYVLPVIEFASQIWSPITKKDCESLEKVQKIFTRAVYARNNKEIPSYKTRCFELGLPLLKERRIVNDLAMAWKIIKGKSRLRCGTFFQYKIGWARNLLPDFILKLAELNSEDMPLVFDVHDGCRKSLQNFCQQSQ